MRSEVAGRNQIAYSGIPLLVDDAAETFDVGRDCRLLVSGNVQAELDPPNVRDRNDEFAVLRLDLDGRLLQSDADGAAIIEPNVGDTLLLAEHRGRQERDQDDSSVTHGSVSVAIKGIVVDFFALRIPPNQVRCLGKIEKLAFLWIFHRKTEVIHFVAKL